MFKGFTPQQTETLARKMGYTGDMNTFNMFLQENPDKGEIFKGYEDQARKRFEGKTFSFAEGGAVNPVVGKLEESIKSGELYKDTKDMMDNPENFVPQVNVQQQTVKSDELVSQSSGQVGPAPQVTAETAHIPTKPSAPTVRTETTQTDVALATEQMNAAQGVVSPQAQITAQTLNPQNLAQLGYSAEQIAQAQTVVAPAARVLEAGESVNGSAVDMDAVTQATDVQAAQANPSVKATVQGQMEGLLQQFDNGQTPPWAAGAMRMAQNQLIARGLGASSIAGQAVIQAAMESALPIAMADAQVNASFEMQNLSNRQQTALFGAEQRAKFLGMKFDQEFQSKVLNAAKISDIANLNFTAQQQVALENAKMAQTVDLANLDAKNAKLMSDLAAMTQVDMSNLNNRQQSAVLNAQAFLQMDLSNLDARQQMEMFKSQSIIQSLFTDAAAENASRQFNATSKAQTDQFFANLRASVDMFNTGQQNDTAQFNAQMRAARDQFNAANRLVIDQSNAQWRRQVSTTNTAMINEANMFEAQAALGLTTAAYNNMMQIERDLYSFAYDSSERSSDRAFQLILAQYQAKAEGKSALGTALGGLAGTLVSKLFG